MNRVIKTKHFSLFHKLSAGYLLLNLFQAVFTPLHFDETYYWEYAQHLDWGYFDHPPMVALLIKISGFFFNGALGIRFITLILNTLTLWILWQLIPVKNKKNEASAWIFFGILLAIPLFHVYSFITTPDVPLLFFTALYLWVFKKITTQNNLPNALLWGFTAALLIYSKYHGGIIIILSVILQPKLLLNRNTYLAGLWALILLLPHILWQYKHDFVTFQYHLFQRTDGQFNPVQVFDYIGGTLGVLNPGWLVLLLILFLKHKKITNNRTDRFYLHLSLSFLVFFLIYAFRARIEAHWVAAAYIPLSLVLYNLYIQNENTRKSMRIILHISILMIFSARILLISGIKIKNLFIPDEALVYMSIAGQAKDKIVVFKNTYQKASKYHFYTGKKACSYNDIYYRKNQYDLFSWVAECHGKKAWVFDYKKDSIALPNGQIWYYRTMDRFPVFSQLKFHFLSSGLPLKQGKNFQIKIYNPYTHTIAFSDKKFSYRFALLFSGKKKNYIVPLHNAVPDLPPKKEVVVNFKTGKSTLPEGAYQVEIVLKAGFLNYQRLCGKPLKISLRNKE